MSVAHAKHYRVETLEGAQAYLRSIHFNELSKLGAALIDLATRDEDDGSAFVLASACDHIDDIAISLVRLAHKLRDTGTTS